MISFMMRVHNEDSTLEKSIESLKQLTCPYEIILVLNNCTDGSEDIANKLAAENRLIKLFKYEYQISRPGYENLCTDVESNHSLASYYNWCLSKCTGQWTPKWGKWTFKWDGDFIMTEKLADYLNKNLDKLDKCRIRISATNSTSNNAELYLTDSLVGYSKYMFWEVPNFDSSMELVLDSGINIIHDSEIHTMKKYWHNEPWFVTENSDEARIVRKRVEMLTNDFGLEPAGLARASNGLCDPYLSRIVNANPSYINFYR